MSDGPAPGEYDEVELLEVIRRMLAEGRAGAETEAHPGQAVYGAYARACSEDRRHGNLAGLVLFWITGGQNNPERLDIADQILNGAGDEPRSAKVFDVVHRLGAGEITWDEFAKVTKKGLIPKERPKVPEPAPTAIPLSKAKDTVETMLVEEEGGSHERPSPERAWKVFTAFARRPVAATPPLHVENDMCLFQWGIYDWGERPHFEYDLTRQFVLHDDDADYDHMEQLSLTLLLDPDDPELVDLVSGDLWSGDDLDAWMRQVEELDVFPVVGRKSSLGVRIDHSDV